MQLLFILLLSLWPLAVIADESNAGSRLSELLDADAAGFAKALTPREFSFPQDHGPHTQFRNEWWYVTGHLFPVDSVDAKPLAFQQTFFRLGLAPVPADTAGSAWSTVLATWVAAGVYVRVASRSARSLGATLRPDRRTIRTHAAAGADSPRTQDHHLQQSVRKTRKHPASGRPG